MSVPKKTPGGVLIGLAGFLGFSIVAGVLVTAMVTPAIAVSGMTANNAVGIFDSLPNYIELGRQVQRNTLYALKGGKQVPFANVFDQNREEVTWNQVSQFVKNAAVDGEDRRFYQHGGVDLQSLFRAGVEYVTKTGGTGGSTIAMQLVRNILVMQAESLPTDAQRKAAYKAAVTPTLDRKLKEVRLAIALSKKYSKQDILLGYLNIANFGGNTYGIQAAAQRYFSTTAANLTLAQSASLMAIVQDPNVRNLDSPKKYPANKARRDVILGAMLQAKDITQAQYDQAIATPIQPVLSNPQNGCLYAQYNAQFFCDYVIRLMTDPKVNSVTSLGATAAERQANWAKGGYNVYTTLNLDQQANAKAQLDQYAPKTWTRFPLGAATTTVEVGTGRILIMAQNKDYNNTVSGTSPTTTAVNYNTDKAYGQSSGFQTGSTYKIFTLTAWLQAGHGLGEYVNATPRTFDSRSFTDTCGGPWFGPYTVTNDAPGPSTTTVSYALAQSINGAFVGMAQKLDLCAIKNDAVAMGVHRADGTPLQTNPSSVLGTNEIAPMTMADAVATIANNGIYCAPIAIDKIVTSLGKELPGQPKSCNQAIAPDIAHTVAYAMAGVTTGGGLGVPSNPNDGTPLIGKTGTTNNAYQTWMVGSTTTTASAVWVGNIYPVKVNGALTFSSLRSYYLPGGLAANARHRIFRATQFSLDKTYGGTAFPAPNQSLLIGTGVTVPDLSGSTPAQAQALLQSLGLVYADGGTVPSALPAGEIVSSSPAAGTKVPLGQTVTATTSDGTLIGMPQVTGEPAKKATSDLVAAGYSQSNITYNWVLPAAPPTTADAPCNVKAQNPAANSPTPKTATITLDVVSGQLPVGGKAVADPSCGV